MEEAVIKKKVGELERGIIRPSTLLRITSAEIMELLREYGGSYKTAWEVFTARYGIPKEVLKWKTFYAWIKRNIESPRPDPTGGPDPVRRADGEMTDREEKNDDFNVDEILSEYEEVAKRW